MYFDWFFFFFKQKTAYEVRISDWSSDVCSSDLVRRLEAMRRAMRSVERDVDGTWSIAPDHVERAAAFEAHRARAAPFIVDTLSAIPLDRQVATDGATWLDRELVAPPPEPLRDAGFGREARAALVQRQQWLMAEGLAQEEQGRMIYRANLL